MISTKVKDLNVLAIYVTDLERSREFYSKQLGFESAGEMPPGILLKSGQVTLYLEGGRKTKRSETSPATEFSPCFAVDSVKAAHDALRAAGVRVVTAYQEFAPTFALFRIADPDGNLIEYAGTP